MRRFVSWFFGFLILVVVGFIVVVLIWPKTATKVGAVASLILVLATIGYAWLTYALVQQTANSVEAMREGNREASASVGVMSDGNALTNRMLAEMRDSRRQAATPIVTAELISSTLTQAFFKLRNEGNSPALNVDVGFRALPPAVGVAPAWIILRRISVLPIGGEVQVEADLTPYRGNPTVQAFGVHADYANILGEGLEVETEFPRSGPDAPPGAATQHRANRRERTR